VSSSLPVCHMDLKTEERNIEISILGKWVTIPALNVNGKNIIVRGKRIKIAKVESEEWLDSELENPELCLQKLSEYAPRFRADIFSFGQMPPSKEVKYPYYKEWDSVAVASTESFNQWWEALPQESRKNVRRSQKRGVVVQVEKVTDKLIENIVLLNNDSPLRQGRPYAHYGKSFEQVKRDQSSFLDRSDYVCAYVGDELIGFLKVVYRGEVASILQVLPKQSQQDKRPANALLAKTVELCEARGVRYLTYGLFNYGNKQDNPLREFKVRNGFEEMLVPRYYIPLTLWGAFCLKTKLHRGLLGILPHWAIIAGVNMRKRWYNFVKEPV